VATERDIAIADQAGRQGPGPGMAIVGDAGMAYPPTETEELLTARLVARWAFKGHDCARDRVWHPGQPEPEVGPCRRHDHGERIEAARMMMDILDLPLERGFYVQG
jgi:hypothetical protein